MSDVRAELRQWVAAMAAAAMMTCSAQAQTAPSSEQLRLSGAKAIAAKLAPDLLAAFGNADTARQLQQSVTPDGTTAGLAALEAGTADIAMASRRVSDDERVNLLGAGFGDPAGADNASVIALEAFVVIVNRDNAIGILTLDQIRRLFSGEIDNWSSLGGRDLPVTIYSRDSTSEAVHAFTAIALNGGKLARSTVVSDSGKSVADAVAADPGGIGFVGFGDLGAPKPVTIALPCGITVEPKLFSVRTEEYPLLRRLYFYTRSDKSPLVRDFQRFSTSAAAQPIVRQAGLTDLTPELAPPGDAMPRAGLWDPSEARHLHTILAGISQSLVGARRLSSTFRFEADGFTPDARARAEIGRIVAYKRAHPSQKLILVGYWNDPGTFDANLTLSARHAQEVATALAAAGARPDQLLAGSTLRPIACADDRARDDRVEVWTR